MGFKDDGLKPKLTEEDKKQALALRKHYRHHLPEGYTAEKIRKMTPRQILELRYGMTYTEYMDLKGQFDMMYDIFGDEADGWYPEWFHMYDPVDEMDGTGPFDDPDNPVKEDPDIPF